jgi:hypothetical protein
MRSQLKHSIPLREPFRTISSGGTSWNRINFWINTGDFYELWDLTEEAETYTGLIQGDVLTVTGSELNAIFAVPNNATYKALDTDYCFFKTNGNVSIACDGNRLIGYDFTRILVRYADNSPHIIHWIGILATGRNVTNNMRMSFRLPIMWSNSWSDYGYEKENRPLTEQIPWEPEAIVPPVLETVTIENADPDKVLLTFDTALDESSIPATTDFTLTGKTITDVEVISELVTLTVSVPYVYSDTGIEISYTVPEENYLRSASGLDPVQSFTDQPVTNNVIIPLGIEKVVNGGFDSDISWSKGANWSIHDGKAYCNASDDLLYQSYLWEDGETYQCSFDLVRSAGSFWPLENLSVLVFNSSGYKSFQFVAAAGGYNYITNGANPAFTGNIDNFSVRRVVPIYTQLLTNSGVSGMTDWVDSNSDGKADNWTNGYANTTYSIVTGNGFTGNAQRMVAVNGGTGDAIKFATSNILKINRKYRLTLRHRNNAQFIIKRGTTETLGTFAANSGDAISEYIEFTPTGTGDLYIYLVSAADWLEIDEVSLKEVAV